MREAVAAGAAIVNDVTALTGDPESLAVAAACGVPVVLMHMQGEPQTMQANPTYESAALDIYRYLAGRVEACVAAGIDPARVVVDPGIGFGKTLAHNLPRSEEHTSELKSLMSISYAVFCLQKNKSQLKNTKTQTNTHND